MADSYKPWQRRGQPPNVAGPGGAQIPEPFNEPVLDQNGRMTVPWKAWLSQVKQQADRSRMQSIAGGTVQPVTYPLALSLGGTHADLSAAGGTLFVLKQSGVGADISSAALVADEIPDLDAGKIASGLLALARGGTHADLSGTGGAGRVLKQSGVGADITSAVLLAAEIPNLDAGQITSGLLALARGGTHADLSGTGGAGQVLQQASAGADITVGALTGFLTSPQLRNSGWVNFWPGNQTPIAMGFPLITTVGAMTDGSDASHPYTQFASSSSGIILGAKPNVSVNLIQPRHNPTLYCALKTGASLATVRYFIGLSWAAAHDGDAPAWDYVGFRFSTNAGDPGWVGQTHNTVSGSVTGKIADIAVNTRYELVFVISGNGSTVSFTVNGGAPVVLSTTMPTGDTSLNWFVQATNLAAVAKDIKVSRLAMGWD